jgi:hypothetical protein
MPDVCRTVQNELRLLSGQAIYVTPPILTAIFFLLNLRPRGPDYPWLRPDEVNHEAGGQASETVHCLYATPSHCGASSSTVGPGDGSDPCAPEAVGGTYPAKPCCFVGSCFPPITRPARSLPALKPPLKGRGRASLFGNRFRA